MSGKKKSIAGKLRELMPACREVTMLIVKHQEAPIGFYNKFKMYFHVYVACKFCRLFFKQSNALHKHIHSLARQQQADTMDYQLSEEQKAKLQAVIEKNQSSK